MCEMVLRAFRDGPAWLPVVATRQDARRVCYPRRMPTRKRSGGCCSARPSRVEKRHPKALVRYRLLASAGPRYELSGCRLASPGGRRQTSWRSRRRRSATESSKRRGSARRQRSGRTLRPGWRSTRSAARRAMERRAPAPARAARPQRGGGAPDGNVLQHARLQTSRSGYHRAGRHAGFAASRRSELPSDGFRSASSTTSTHRIGPPPTASLSRRRLPRGRRRPWAMLVLLLNTFEYLTGPLSLGNGISHFRGRCISLQKPANMASSRQKQKRPGICLSSDSGAF